VTAKAAWPNFGIGLIPVMPPFDLPALNQSFVYALECLRTGNAFVRYSDCHEPAAVLRIFHLAVSDGLQAVMKDAKLPAVKRSL
jgi:hypothetical protein